MALQCTTLYESSDLLWYPKTTKHNLIQPNTTNYKQQQPKRNKNNQLQQMSTKTSEPSPRPVLTMDLPDDKDKLSIRVTLSRDTSASQTRLRQHAAAQMQQARIAQSRHNRLLQDLMQVNFDRQNLATAMS